MLAAPIMSHKDIFTTFDVQFWRIFTWLLVLLTGKNKNKGKVPRTVSRISPIRLNVAYSFGKERGKEGKRKLKYKRTSFTSIGKHCIGHLSNPLRSHWSPPFFTAKCTYKYPKSTGILLYEIELMFYPVWKFCGKHLQNWTFSLW